MATVEKLCVALAEEEFVVSFTTEPDSAGLKVCLKRLWADPRRERDRGTVIYPGM